MLEVGDNEPDSVTKTGADSEVPTPREAAWCISREKSTRVDGGAPRAAALRPEGAMQRQREGRCSLGDGLERTALLRRG